MSSELIINATLPETRIALLENNEIQEMHIERDSERGIVGNIYKGRVLRVLPGMQAAFVDIGLERAAFLYVDDIIFPDVECPLTTQPLPDPEEVNAAIAAEAQERGRYSERGGRERAPRGEFQGGRGGHGRGGRPERTDRGKPAGRVVLPRRQPTAAEQLKNPYPPDSPEAHAWLQRQYAKLIVDIDEDNAAASQESVPAQAETSATEQQPEAPSVVASEREPDSEQQTSARSPQQEQPADEIAEDEESASFSEEGLDEGDDSQESAAIYRPEPVVDPDAWVQEIAESSALEEDDEGAVNEAEGAAPENLEAAQTEATSAVATPAEVTTEQAPAAEGQEAAPSVAVQPVVNVKPVGRPQNGRRSRDDSLRRKKRRESANIADLVKEGQEIIVQVAKEPIGTKGARLTCYVSLPGRYLVFMPSVDHIGVSRRIESELERRRLKETIDRVRPEKTGVIVRTASGKQTDQKLKADLDFLVETWNEIQQKFKKQKSPTLLYQDLTIVLRAIRDMFTEEVDRVVVDSKREHKAIMRFVMRFMPNMKDKVDLYTGEMPIFDYYAIEPELERALEKRVWLKSGGYLVIDQAEALVAIDVNTGRYVGKTNLEETILKTNLEAVKEIAYQLRLRNFGGIIILDLIDMEKDSNKEKVYKALEEALKKDRARPTIMKISQLGLIEMTRKRTRDSLTRSLCETCSNCQGRSFVKSKLTIAYGILRDIEREGMDKEITEISIQCHPSVSDILLGEKQDVVENMEHLFQKKVTIRANGAYHSEQYEIVAHRGDGKSIVSSSEERRQQLRQRIHEHEKSLQQAKRNRNNNDDDGYSDDRRFGGTGEGELAAGSSGPRPSGEPQPRGGGRGGDRGGRDRGRRGGRGRNNRDRNGKRRGSGGGQNMQQRGGGNYGAPRGPQAQVEGVRPPEGENPAQNGDVQPQFDSQQPMRSVQPNSEGVEPGQQNYNNEGAGQNHDREDNESYGNTYPAIGSRQAPEYDTDVDPSDVNFNNANAPGGAFHPDTQSQGRAPSGGHRNDRHRRPPRRGGGGGQGGGGRNFNNNNRRGGGGGRGGRFQGGGQGGGPNRGYNNPNPRYAQNQGGERQYSQGQGNDRPYQNQYPQGDEGQVQGPRNENAPGVAGDEGQPQQPGQQNYGAQQGREPRQGGGGGRFDRNRGRRGGRGGRNWRPRGGGGQGGPNQGGPNRGYDPRYAQQGPAEGGGQPSGGGGEPFRGGNEQQPPREPNDREKMERQLMERERQERQLEEQERRDTYSSNRKYEGDGDGDGRS